MKVEDYARWAMTGVAARIVGAELAGLWVSIPEPHGGNVTVMPARIEASFASSGDGRHVCSSMTVVGLPRRPQHSADLVAHTWVGPTDVKAALTQLPAWATEFVERNNPSTLCDR